MSSPPFYYASASCLQRLSLLSVVQVIHSTEVVPLPRNLLQHYRVKVDAFLYFIPLEPILQRITNHGLQVFCFDYRLKCKVFTLPLVRSVLVETALVPCTSFLLVFVLLSVCHACHLEVLLKVEETDGKGHCCSLLDH